MDLFEAASTRRLIRLLKFTYMITHSYDITPKGNTLECCVTFERNMLARIKFFRSKNSGRYIENWALAQVRVSYQKVNFTFIHRFQ